MNARGHRETLVASHPGNRNAVKYGVHSSGLIEGRAKEIAAELAASFEFSAVERVALAEAARCMAVLEAIDRDLDQRGLVDKQGAPRYLLNHRSRISRQLDQWLDKLGTAMARRTASELPVRADLPDYVQALQQIALGRDETATARDRLAALERLLELGTQGQTSYLDRPGQVELRKRKMAVREAREAQELTSSEIQLGLTDEQ